MYFRSLKKLTLTDQATLPSQLVDFIKTFPPVKYLESLGFHTEGITVPEAEEILKTLRNYLNLSTLRSLSWHDWADNSILQASNTSQMDVDVEMTLKLSPLLHFTRLEQLTVSLHQVVEVTPEDVALILRTWPNIEVLDVRCKRSRDVAPPLIDHTYFLSILENCRSLRHLGLPFDAGRITGREKSPLAPFPLKTLGLQVTPIYSPTRVLQFLEGNFAPRMEIEDDDDIFEDDQENDSVDFLQRWKSVFSGWKERQHTARGV